MSYFMPECYNFCKVASIQISDFRMCYELESFTQGVSYY